jgi:hypothetical protein
MTLVAIYYFGSKFVEKVMEEDGSPQVDNNNPEESLNISGDESKVEVNLPLAAEPKGNFWRSVIAMASRKKEAHDSIYEVEKPKVVRFKLNNDASTLGFACFIEKDALGLNLSGMQQSDVY